jgi:hypothetical protein
MSFKHRVNRIEGKVNGIKKCKVFNFPVFFYTKDRQEFERQFKAALRKYGPPKEGQTIFVYPGQSWDH